VIKPSFHPNLESLEERMNTIMKQIKQFQLTLENELGIDIQLIPHKTYTYVFECHKHKGDRAIRNSSRHIKKISLKKNKMSFTCNELNGLALDYSEHMGQYR